MEEDVGQWAHYVLHHNPSLPYGMYVVVLDFVYLGHIEQRFYGLSSLSHTRIQ